MAFGGTLRGLRDRSLAAGCKGNQHIGMVNIRYIVWVPRMVICKGPGRQGLKKKIYRDSGYQGW